MATGAFDPNCIVPVVANVSVSNTAVPLKTSSTLAVKFTICNPTSNGVKLWIGDSTVAANKAIAELASGSSVTFGPDEIIGGRQKVSYDLARFYVITTSTSKVACLTIYSKGGSNGPF